MTQTERDAAGEEEEERYARLDCLRACGEMCDTCELIAGGWRDDDGTTYALSNVLRCPRFVFNYSPEELGIAERQRGRVTR